LWDEFSSDAAILARYDKAVSGDQPNLTGSWGFDEGRGGIADDQGGRAHHGRLMPGAFWSEESSPVGACATTDLEGNYVFESLRYGDGRTFRVSPSFPGHQFEPGFKNIALASGSPVQNEVEFRDVTTFTLSGNIRFTDSNCFTENVQVMLDGQARGTTDKNGNYSISVNPGTHELRPSLAGHAFEPEVLEILAEGDRAALDFEDATRTTLSGRVGGGCGLSIGTIRLRIFPENNCLDPIFVDAESLYSVGLIPQTYFVQVEDVIGQPEALDRADILAFFRDLGVRRVELAAGGAVLDFIYRAPLQVGVTGYPEPPSCGTFNDPERGILSPAVPVIGQTEHYPLTITVFEDYGSAGLCPVDSGTVTIFDEIIDQEDAPVTLAVRDGIALTADGKPYATAGNNPNIFSGRLDADGNDRSYQKPISFVAQVEGRAPTTRTDWALVTGYRARSATFTSVTQEIPLMILRDPPGDASSAFIEKGETHCCRPSSGSTSSPECSSSPRTRGRPAAAASSRSMSR
ncbi:MAG: hypothetical protein FD129_1140, partial [bacterium]